MNTRGNIAGNTATGTLKLIALGLMFCDHAGKMLFDNLLEMRLVGRLAFPLYCWCLVVGFCRTRCVWKYMLRVLVVGLVSQPLYRLALNHAWTEPNIFLSLFLALGGLWGIREKKWFSHIWAPLGALALAHGLGCDYGWQGVMLVFLLYAVSDSRSGLAAVMIAFCLYWGSSSASIRELFGWKVQWPKGVSSLMFPWMKVQSFAVLSLPLMLCRFEKDIRMPSWLGYALYPAHLAVLYALEMCM